MEAHNSAPLHLILVIAALLLFIFAAGAFWVAPDWPHRTRLIAAGLACWVASTFF
jgi:hypothetical protein